MSIAEDTKSQVAEIGEKYKYGFVTDIEMERAPKGLSEDTVRYISAKKGEPGWMLDWRLAAFRRWGAMKEPQWARVHYPAIDYQDAYYYAAPKLTPKKQSLDEVDPKLLETYNKLGIPLHEQMALAGVAVDAVFDPHVRGDVPVIGVRDIAPHAPRRSGDVAWHQRLRRDEPHEDLGKGEREHDQPEQGDDAFRDKGKAMHGPLLLEIEIDELLARRRGQRHDRQQ